MVAASTRKTGLIVALVLACGVFAKAGDLAPPAGPVAPTMKPLTDVEPRVAINATNTPGDSDSVFRITQPGSYYLTGNVQGVASKSCIEIACSDVSIDLMGFTLQGVVGSLDGIRESGSQDRLSIRNGSIRGFGQDGINLQSGNRRLIEGIQCANNASNGIKTGSEGSVRHCAANANGGTGIVANYGMFIDSCDCHENNTYGISAGASAHIFNCLSDSNAGIGINVGAQSTILNCTTNANHGDGIRVASTCLVRDNHCTNDGFSTSDGAAIHTTGNFNKIEGNHCMGADRGIEVAGTGNIVMRNTCTACTTHFVVAGGNVCFAVHSVLTPAFSGVSGGVPPGSTDPNANFTF